MARDLGYDRAKAFGDGHEVSVPNAPSERMMDLYNNEVGRQLALDPANRTRPADVGDPWGTRGRTAAHDALSGGAQAGWHTAAVQPAGAYRT
jgi:hypothetical protein